MVVEVGSAHAAHVDLRRDFLLGIFTVAVRHIDVSVRLYAAVVLVAGVMALATGVIALDVLEVLRHPGAPGVGYRFHVVVADRAVLRLFHLHLVRRE